MLVATRSTTKPSVTHQHAFINELSLGSLILSTFEVFCPKRVQTARTVSSCADCTRNKIFGQTTWQLRGSFRVQTARARCRVQTARARCLVQTLHAEQDFWADYVASTWQLSCADCTRTVSCADCTRNKILGRLRGIDVASTWHRRGNCRSQNVVQLQASTQRDSKQFHTREHTVLLPRGH